MNNNYQVKDLYTRLSLVTSSNFNSHCRSSETSFARFPRNICNVKLIFLEYRRVEKNVKRLRFFATPWTTIFHFIWFLSINWMQSCCEHGQLLLGICSSHVLMCAGPVDGSAKTSVWLPLPNILISIEIILVSIRVENNWPHANNENSANECVSPDYSR